MKNWVYLLSIVVTIFVLFLGILLLIPSQMSSFVGGLAGALGGSLIAVYAAFYAHHSVTMYEKRTKAADLADLLILWVNEDDKMSSESKVRLESVSAQAMLWLPSDLYKQIAALLTHNFDELETLSHFDKSRSDYSDDNQYKDVMVDLMLTKIKLFLEGKAYSTVVSSCLKQRVKWFIS
ncbi:hypothetical protein AB4298_00775 [Shewanella sp. 10N.261.52.F9]|uniref:hypothetical protein n=1 Tax=Shewanella sp. 10N.261.52.F9 TaxID=3229684 RepID=UPI00354CA79F